MIRVLLTGAGGFVGHHTLEHILTITNWEVVCTDSFQHAGKTDRISEVLESEAGKSHNWSGRVSVITHDLNAPISLQMAHKIGKVHAIISMASESHVDRSITDPVPFIQNNVNLVLNLLEYQRHYQPAAIFLQVSTDEVYGPAPKDVDHPEWSTLLPSNPYSASKAAQEVICQSYWRTYGTPLILTNTMNIIGERQDPEKYVPMVISKVLNGETVNIHGSADKVPGSRYYLHARNQADALVFLLETYLGMLLEEYWDDSLYWHNYENNALIYNENAVSPPKYNIVGEREVDNLELAQMIAKFAGKELNYEMTDFHSSRPGHDLRYALDGTKMEDLGWKAPFSLEETMKHTVNWSINHPEWLA